MWKAAFSPEDGGVRLQIGQLRCHMRLHPDETMRTPRVTLVAYTGDETRGMNMWRRWYIDHILPRENDATLPPKNAASTSLVPKASRNLPARARKTSCAALCPIFPAACARISGGSTRAGIPASMNGHASAPGNPPKGAFPAVSDPLAGPVRKTACSFFSGLSRSACARIPNCTSGIRNGFCTLPTRKAAKTKTTF